VIALPDFEERADGDGEAGDAENEADAEAGEDFVAAVAVGVVAVGGPVGDGEADDEEAGGEDVGGGFHAIGHRRRGAGGEADGDLQYREGRAHRKPGESDTPRDLIGRGHKLQLQVSR